MRAVAHSKRFADKVDVPQAVGQEFEAADKARAKKTSVKDQIEKRYKTPKKK